MKTKRQWFNEKWENWSKDYYLETDEDRKELERHIWLYFQERYKPCGMDEIIQPIDDAKDNL